MAKARVYLDSCCFIEAVKLGRDAPASPVERERAHCAMLLESAAESEIEIFTSMIAVAECVAAQRGDANVPQEIKDRFIALFTSGKSGVVLIEVGIFVVERSRDLRWKQKLVLGALDSIHVASALDTGCEELVTLDRKLLALSKKKLELRFVKPSATQCLPDTRKQTKLGFKPKSRAIS